MIGPPAATATGADDPIRDDDDGHTAAHSTPDATRSTSWIHETTKPVFSGPVALESRAGRPSWAADLRMTSKGPSHVDLENAELVADATVGRRHLIGMAGLAGLAGAAASLLAGSTTRAAAPVDDRPNQPTEADTELLRRAMAMELAATDLYLARLEFADDPEDLARVIGVMAENHQAYAQAIAGAAGLTANGARDDALYDDQIQGFTQDFATAAHAFEQSAVATHSALVDEYESIDAISLTVSILIIEARQATVLADVLGVDDLDVIFGNEQSAFELEGNA